jgi:nucleotide-binding universal stress UspA family protein
LSEGSAEAFEYARTLGRTFGARLHLLHVFETTGFVNAISANGYAAIIPDLFDDLIAEKRKQVEALLSREDLRRYRVKTTVRPAGSPAREIVSYAEAENIDLIVIGTHGRTGLAHVLLGSVAEAVVRHAGCPVITVRRPAVAPGSGAEALPAAAIANPLSRALGATS